MAKLLFILLFSALQFEIRAQKKNKNRTKRFSAEQKNLMTLIPLYWHCFAISQQYLQSITMEIRASAFLDLEFCGTVEPQPRPIIYIRLCIQMHVAHCDGHGATA